MNRGLIVYQMYSTCLAHPLILVPLFEKQCSNLIGTPFAIVPSDHYSGKAPDLVQRKVDSAGDFSNVDLSALIALVVIQSFAVPPLVPDSKQGMLIDADSQK